MCLSLTLCLMAAAIGDFTVCVILMEETVGFCQAVFQAPSSELHRRVASSLAD